MIEEIRKYYKLLIKPTDGYVSRYINRRISIPITLVIIRYKIPLTPNQVSFISFLIGLAASLAYILESPLLAGVLVQLSSIIDGVDGELARLLGKQSRLGAFIDALLDRLANIAIIASLAYFIATNIHYPASLTLIVSLLAISGDLMVSYIHARGEASLGIHPSKIGKIRNFASRDVRLFIIFIGTVIRAYFETLLIVSILSYVYVIAKSIEVFFSVHES